MSDEPAVSVILPVYDGEPYLAQAIDSVLGQAHRPYELIVVDDGSTDGSASVAARYGAPLRLVRQAHAGGAAALNRGVELATGRYLAFIDADDLWQPDKLRLQLDAFARQPPPDLVFGHVLQFHSPELPAALKARIHCPPEPQPGRSALCLLARRDTCLRVGPYATGFRTGWFIDWYMRAMDLGLRSVMLPDVVARRRLHGANLGLRDRDGRMDYTRVLKAGLDRRRGQAPPP
jgi:glycosyltransferase involved in cell wall biosynthesis